MMTRTTAQAPTAEDDKDDGVGDDGDDDKGTTARGADDGDGDGCLGPRVHCR